LLSGFTRKLRRNAPTTCTTGSDPEPGMRLLVITHINLRILRIFLVLVWRTYFSKATVTALILGLLLVAQLLET
jgi:hypothetical protein